MKTYTDHVSEAAQCIQDCDLKVREAMKYLRAYAAEVNTIDFDQFVADVFNHEWRTALCADSPDRRATPAVTAGLGTPPRHFPHAEDEA